MFLKLRTDSNKREIRAAVELLFGVKVEVCYDFKR